MSEREKQKYNGGEHMAGESSDKQLVITVGSRMLTTEVYLSDIDEVLRCFERL
jgi:hypothetical protein